MHGDGRRGQDLTYPSRLDQREVRGREVVIGGRRSMREEEGRFGRKKGEADPTVGVDDEGGEKGIWR